MKCYSKAKGREREDQMSSKKRSTTGSDTIQTWIVSSCQKSKGSMHLPHEVIAVVQHDACAKPLKARNLHGSSLASAEFVPA